jgi:hypothetical protein
MVYVSMISLAEMKKRHRSRTAPTISKISDLTPASIPEINRVDPTDFFQGCACLAVISVNRRQIFQYSHSPASRDACTSLCIVLTKPGIFGLSKCHSGQATLEHCGSSVRRDLIHVSPNEPQEMLSSQVLICFR